MEYKALVIEDDPKAVELVEDVLAALSHEHDLASSLVQARRLVREGDYSYILLDIEFPARSAGGVPRIQNAENFLDDLAAAKGKEKVKVIVMLDKPANTIELTVEMMRLAANLRDRGATDFIGKPFPTAGRTLDRVIKKVLGLNGSRPVNSESAPNHQVSVRDEEPAGPRASCTKPVSSSAESNRTIVTKPQADILTALSAEPGKTMFQVDIIAAAGYGKHATSQHLARLRKLGLICQPQGPRGGFALTDEGRIHFAQESNTADA